MSAAEEKGRAVDAGPERPVVELVPPYVDEGEDRASLGWAPESLADLDWALMRVGELEEQVQANEEVAAERHKEIDRRTIRMNEKANADIRYFRDVITQYATSHRAQLLGSGKRKSRELQHGRVGWKTRPACLKTSDSKALLAWAQSQPVELGLVRIKEEPCLEEIKRHAERSKTVPPGMEMEPETETLQVHAEVLLKGVL